VGADGRTYHYAEMEPPSAADGHRPTLRGLSVFETANGPYRLISHTFAARARDEGDGWRLEQGWMQRFDAGDGGRRAFDSERAVLTPIDDFRRSQVDPASMTFRESLDYVQRLAASGYNVADQRVALHKKLAYPLVTFVLTLLAIPFGLTVGRKGTLYGIGLAAILAGAYFLVMTVFMAVGAAGLLPPVLAAWGANIIFAAGAAYLVLTVRT
jgi:lipopolysaccharide export LptBFGC system permease protein LptF